ncbi:MAG: orotate phosphoribosyltransferase [Clostridiales bacterium]|nr:orotate phosphoribosyltransferase [Clostridiales bacterium]
MNLEIVENLFKTEAFRVAPEGSLFWYTSGKLGPFYINTHFLYGSEGEANSLLSKIDALSKDRPALTAMLVKESAAQYEKNEIFRDVCNALVKIIREKTKSNAYDYISGGERRDWFFSVMCSSLLKKPHLTLYKNKEASLIIDGKYQEISHLKGARCLHIADLVTEASSYERAWIPAVSTLGGKMPMTVVVVDRKQGGVQLLKNLGVETFSLTEIDKGMFDLAAENSLITANQYRMLVSYMKDTTASVNDFLKKNPDFIKKSLSSDEKTAMRARLCMEKGFYNIK